MQQTARSEVVAVVLNYQNDADTLRCVESVARCGYQALRVLVVDNGSERRTLDRLRNGLDPTVEVLISPDNLGYAGGNNLALKRILDSDANFAWVLNPDIVVHPDALDHLVRTGHRHPDAGIVGSRILYGGSNPAKIWFDGGIIDWETSGSPSHLLMGALEADHAPGFPYDVDYVTGAGMLLRVAMMRHVGLIPEDWFLYFEETEYNLRVQEAGWRTMVDPRSRLHHFQRSTGHVPQPTYIYYFIRNRYRFGIERRGSISEGDREGSVWFRGRLAAEGREGGTEMGSYL